MKFVVFNYDNGVVDEVFGLVEDLPTARPGYGFRKEWVTLRKPFFGERAVLALGYYKQNKTTGDWEPSLLFVGLDQQLAVQPKNKPKGLDPRLAIK